MGSVQTLQALDCHSEKTLRLESRVAPGVMEYVRSPKLPLVFEAQTCAKDSTYVGVDVVRCRRNGLANAPFPLPILCPADGVEPVDGVLPDLGFVEGCCDARQSCLNLLPYVGPGWYPKVSLAAMLELGRLEASMLGRWRGLRCRAGAAGLRCRAGAAGWRSAKPYDPYDPYDSAGWRVREEHVHPTCTPTC